MDWIMRKALAGTDVGLEWTNGSKLRDLDYADDIVLIDTSRDRMQSMTKAVENEGRKVGLTMNNKKCKVMVSNAWEDSSEIKIGELAVETVEDFCYLGSCVTSNGNCDKDCQQRIGKANSVFGRLKDIWKSKHISLKVKVRLWNLWSCQHCCIVQSYGLCLSHKRKNWKQPITSSNDDYWVYPGRTKYEMKRSGNRQNWKN